MNRRSFLTQFLQGAIVAVAAPQIVTHGLKLWTPRQGKITAYWYQGERISFWDLLGVIYDIKRNRESSNVSDRIEFYTDVQTQRFFESFSG